MAAERNIPNNLQECVFGLHRDEAQRQMQMQQRAMRFAQQKAPGTCLAMRKPPREIAREFARK